MKDSGKISFYINNDIEYSGVGHTLETIFNNIPLEHISCVNINNTMLTDINIIELTNNYKTKYGDKLKVFNYINESISDCYNFMLKDNVAEYSVFVRPYVTEIPSETLSAMLNKCASSNNIGVVGCKSYSHFNKSEVISECVNMFDKDGFWFNEFSNINYRTTVNGSYKVESVNDSILCIKTSVLTNTRGFNIAYKKGLFTEDLSLSLLSSGFTNIAINKPIYENSVKKVPCTDEDKSYFHRKWINQGNWAYVYPE